MDRIAIGVYFSNDNVKEKFTNECINKLDKVYAINEVGRVFSFTNEDASYDYLFYHFPLIDGASISPKKLQSILFVIDDEWVDFDEMFNGVCEANIDIVTVLYLGNDMSKDDIKISCDIGAYMKKVYAKCEVKQLDIEKADKKDLLDFFASIKDRIYSTPFVFNSLDVSYLGSTKIKCSGTLNYGFFQKGDRIAIYSEGGREVVGTVVKVFAFSINATRNAKKGQDVRFEVELDEKYFIEASPIQAISKDRVIKKAKIVNALVTMYDAEFDGHRTLEVNSMVEFHLLGTATIGKILNTGSGYLDGEMQSFKRVSSGGKEIFSMVFGDAMPLVNGTDFYLEKPWDSGSVGSYGYAKIIEIIE